MKINILFTSAGRRNYLINYFKEALNGNGSVIAADFDLLAPALVDADIAIKVPSFYDDSYIPKLKDIIKEHNVSAIISLNDLELPLLSKNKSIFEKLGVKLIVSNEMVIDTSFDKFKTFKFLKKIGVNTAKTYNSLEGAKQAINDGSLQFPLVLKPRWGSGSIDIEFPESIEELDLYYKVLTIKMKKSILNTASKEDISQSILIQEKLDGIEFGFDVLNNFDSSYYGTFAREKISMRSGETDKAKTVKNAQLELIGEKISEHLKHIGNIDCDAFLVNGTFYLLEINPRFGGGYPFSHEAGINMAAIYVGWLRGLKNEDLKAFNDYKTDVILAKCDRLLKVTLPLNTDLKENKQPKQQ